MKLGICNREEQPTEIPAHNALYCLAEPSGNEQSGESGFVYTALIAGLGLWDCLTEL